MSKHCYDWPRPAVTVDLAVFSMDDYGHWHTLLIRRGKPPHEGLWAIPGGFLEMGETGAGGALRELEEETGYRTTSTPNFLGVYDAVDRDPRDRVITLAYMSVIPNIQWGVEGRDDAAEARWFPLAQMPEGLAFDHDRIMFDAMSVLAGRLQVPPALLRTRRSLIV